MHRTYVGRLERGESGVTVEALATILASRMFGSRPVGAKESSARFDEFVELDVFEMVKRLAAHPLLSRIILNTG